MSGRDLVDNILIIFGNAFITSQEYTGYSQLYDFTNIEDQSIFNISLYIIKNRLKRNTQTPYDREAILLYAKNKSLTLPFDINNLNKSSSEVLFGVVR